MDQLVRMLISVIGGLGAAAGVFVGFNWLVDQARPKWPYLTAGFGGVVGLIVGAVLQHNGWFPPGIFGILLGIVLGIAAGYGLGTIATPELEQRTRWEGRLRPIGFVGPAVFFVGFGLIAPSLRTIATR